MGKKENKNSSRGFLIFDLDIFNEEVDDILAVLLFHKLYYVCSVSRKIDGYYVHIPSRDLARYFHTTAATIMRKLNILQEAGLISYKVENKNLLVAITWKGSGIAKYYSVNSKI